MSSAFNFGSTPSTAPGFGFSSSTSSTAPGFGFSSSTSSTAPGFGFSSSTTSFGSSSSASSFSSRSAKSTVTTPVNEKPLTDTEDDLRKRISFLSGFMVAFKDQIHTDIKLKPNNGPCISAHRSLLEARSEIFKNILSSDNFKAPPTDTDTMTLSELSTEELESLLEFLYTGDLPADKFKKHVYALCAAADKYEIPYLQESCERYMLNSLNASNALDILDLSNLYSKKKLKETTLNFIVRNMKSIVSSQKYEEFASSNPHLCVEVSRAFVEAKF
ncbi:BTB/POZ domain-containing protein At3g56230 isoform X3 [Gossypium raimondii]|uniref:BTB/POZ domain-containing protein At3g56230 isoform X2 n=1 Tax=Gossypium raimondii TaxID=29730 RepID=UPI00227AB77C|nr:BTB/POZ domain-containing protein At3g56230 isoform X2 [Gossypium raimondii]XP_052485756.1 BTB/POZ domain-containing protein At3g56230 isoform X3 [Gossypium raimondii]